MKTSSPETASRHFVSIHHKRHLYTLKPLEGSQTTFVKCPDAAIAQEFLNEDIPALLTDLPHLIVAEQLSRQNKDQVIRFRVSREEKQQITEKAKQEGFETISAFIKNKLFSKIIA